VIVTSEAIVLRARKHGETSKIVTLYTLAYGKVNVIAKGAREMKSKFGGALESFAHMSAIFYKKEKPEAGLYLLSKAELIGSNAAILKSLAKIEAATGIIELVLRSMHDEEANPAIFELLRSALAAIDTSSDAAATPLEFWFAIQLLELMGVGIASEHPTLVALTKASPEEATAIQISERDESRLRGFLQAYYVEHLPGITGRSMKSGRVFSSL
jgi:DNA repair protein RecO (recombination protein O)